MLTFMRKYTRLYEWPNSADSEAKAKDFFTRAKLHFESFPFTEDAAICLCEIPRSFRWGCLVFVASDSSRDDSVERANKIKAFLQGAGCPEEQETEDANWDGKMAIDTIDKSLSLAGVRVVERVVRRGVAPSEQVRSAVSPSQVAAFFEVVKRGNIETAKTQLKDCPDLIFSKDDDGETPLHVAGNKEVAELLLANGANVKAENKYHHTPLTRAAVGGRLDVAELLRQHAKRK